MKSAIKINKKLYNFDILYFMFCRTGQDIGAGMARGDNQATGDGSRHAHCRPSRHSTSHLLYSPNTPLLRFCPVADPGLLFTYSQIPDQSSKNQICITYRFFST
jgi:hypothetical protein